MTNEKDRPSLPPELAAALDDRVAECDALIESVLIDALVAHRNRDYEALHSHTSRVKNLANFVCEARRFSRWPWDKKT